MRSITPLVLVAGLVFANASLGFAEPDYVLRIERGMTNLGNRELNVHLSRRPTVAELEADAKELRLAEPGRGPLFIRYYLQDLPANAGTWANINFNPDMWVYIRGLTEQDEQKLQAAKLPQGESIVGAWIATLPIASHRAVIYSRKGKTYLNRFYGNGSGSDTSNDVELVLKQKGVLKAYFDVDGGQHYVVTKSGDLEYWDELGRIGTARKVTPVGTAARD